MRRVIARWSGWWMRLFVVSVFALQYVRWPSVLEVGLMAGLFVLGLVRPPWERDRRPVQVASPVQGRWVVVNSPASKVPSHGIRSYGQTYAVDIVLPSPPGTSPRIGWGVGMRRPERFPSFGEPVHAMAGGTVVAAASRQRDHRSRETWPALAYLMVVEAFFRELGGTRFIFGNHVIVDHGDGVHSVYAHLRRGSLRVGVGDRVSAGDHLGDVGNSGNSSEPHLHVQLMDRPVPSAAAGVPFRWSNVDIAPGDIDMRWSAKEAPDTVEPGLPANGQVFSSGQELASATPADEPGGPP